MKKEILFATLIVVLSWTASTFFTNGVEEIVDNYFLEKYHNRAIVYFLFSIFFILLTVYFAVNTTKKL